MIGLHLLTAAGQIAFYVLLSYHLFNLWQNTTICWIDNLWLLGYVWIRLWWYGYIVAAGQSCSIGSHLIEVNIPQIYTKQSLITLLYYIQCLVLLCCLLDHLHLIIQLVYFGRYAIAKYYLL